MRVTGLILWAQEVPSVLTWYEQILGLPVKNGAIILPDGIRFLWQENRPSCPTRGPHGVVPALEVDDIAQAKAWLRAVERPIVFEEIIPGLARLTFLDPAGIPIDLVQVLEVQRWQRGQQIPLGTAQHPPVISGLFEISVYVENIRNALAFYRDVLHLETGLTYFAHYHLLFTNVPLVLRPTWHRCPQQAPHTPALLIQGVYHCPAEYRLSPPFAPTQLACWDGEHTWIFWEDGT